MTYDEIYEKVEELREAIVSSTIPVEPQDLWYKGLGLDGHPGAILVGDDFIVSLMPHSLDCLTIGEMEIYFAKGNDRIQRILDFVNKEQNNEQ